MSALAGAGVPARIGRFDIVKELGHGSQGAVYLASDTRLGRAVALKTLRLDTQNGKERQHRVRTLLDEARIVSSLQHPNIVTLHDAGEDNGQPFLVFEYVEGRTLKAFIKENGPIAPARSAEITLQILQGIGHAHSKGVLHRDLKPDNVMLTTEGVARVMDFGIASQALEPRPGETALRGTPAYMAPEYIATRIYGKASDLFSLGLVLYEMLTGKRAVQGTDITGILHTITNLALKPPSSLQPQVDERLDSIVATALARRPEKRYPDAGVMAAALTDWLYPAAEVTSEGKQGTLDFLLRRMRHKSDLPALSSTISSINKVVAGDCDHTSVLCNSILHDVSLTAKLLKLVNAAFYSQFGGSVSTVSRAVAILGFNRVRTIALSLVLFEHLQNKAQASSLKDEVVACYLSAVVACQLVEKAGIDDAEEFFICAMFHRLGKLLVAFYLFDEAEAIPRLMQARNLSEESAARLVLGLDYADIGQGVARDWNLPEVIVESMQPLRDKVKDRSAFEKDKLRALSDLAWSLTDLVRESDAEVRRAGLQRLTAKFGGAIPVNEKSLLTLMDESVKSLVRDADFMGFGVGQSKLIAEAKSWTGQTPGPAAADDSDSANMATLVELTQIGDTDPERISVTQIQNSAEHRRTVLAAGVQEITNSLVGDFQLNDILHIILETMYRAIGFKRVLICIRESKRDVLRSRFGFGADVDRLIAEGFAVPLGEERDIFYVALARGVDICIEDLQAENIRRHIPDWFRSRLSPHGLILFPILVKGRAVALIYADAEDPALLRFAPEELSMLKTLRNQAVLAIKQAH